MISETNGRTIENIQPQNSSSLSVYLVSCVYRTGGSNYIITPEQQKDFASRVANIQKEVVHEKVAE
jgi:hypothetical protein